MGEELTYTHLSRTLPVPTRCYDFPYAQIEVFLLQGTGNIWVLQTRIISVLLIHTNNEHHTFLGFLNMNALVQVVPHNFMGFLSGPRLETCNLIARVIHLPVQETKRQRLNVSVLPF